MMWRRQLFCRPLLDFAAKSLPVKSQPDTQLFVLATAGMRLLPKDKQDKLLANLRVSIPLHYNFDIEDNLEVITGKQEGAYQWLAINYILGNFEHQAEKVVGALDMGGASMQIAFQVSEESGRAYSVSWFESSLDVSEENIFEYYIFLMN